MNEHVKENYLFQEGGHSMKSNTGSANQLLGKDEALEAVPESARQHWLTPAIIFGGLEFTIPVLMTGAILVGSFGLSSILLILVVALLIQWIGNGVMGF